jgi:hypothetical protein
VNALHNCEFATHMTAWMIVIFSQHLEQEGHVCDERVT